MQRRHFLQTLAAAPAILSAQTPRPPNIVFILADDLGYGDIGCFGQNRIRTPNIDRLAGEGIRFTQAYSGSTVCAPSRCCLMTGKHTGHATIRGNQKPELGLGAAETTVASALKAAGYETALFGKWGLGGPGTGSLPNTRGFDHFYGYLDQQHAHNAYPEHLWNNQNEVFLTENWFHGRKRFAPDLFADRAIDFLAASRQKPFFLYFATILPHANNELGRIQANGMESPDLGPYGDRPWPEVEKTFAAAVTRVDSYVGRILEAIDRAGMTENTLVVFSSDNGPHAEGNHSSTFFESSGPFHGIKRDLYEGGIRVPAVSRWKGTIRPGQVSGAQWAFWDFLPSACELARTAPPAGIDGVNALPALLEGKPVRHEYFYWEFHEGGFAQALRQGNWKLVRQRPKFDYELFDLEKDPAERHNVARQNPEVVGTLRKVMESARSPHPAFPVA